MRKFGYFAILFWLFVWHFAALAIDNRFLLVGPWQVALRLSELVFEAHFWASIGFSLGRIVVGFVLAMLCGVILAALAAMSKYVYALLLPPINVMKSIPIASFTIIALMWVATSGLPVITAFITVVPIVFFNTYQGLVNTDRQLLDMAKVFRAPRLKVAMHVYGAHAMPHVLSAASSGLGFAFRASVAAELIGMVQNSIGFNFHTARTFLMTADVFAWTVTIVILSYAVEKLFQILVKAVKL